MIIFREIPSSRTPAALFNGYASAGLSTRWQSSSTRWQGKGNSTRRSPGPLAYRGLRCRRWPAALGLNSVAFIGTMGARTPARPSDSGTPRTQGLGPAVQESSVTGMAVDKPSLRDIGSIRSG